LKSEDRFPGDSNFFARMVTRDYAEANNLPVRKSYQVVTHPQDLWEWVIVDVPLWWGDDTDERYLSQEKFSYMGHGVDG
jgi:hypothetical protein